MGCHGDNAYLEVDINLERITHIAVTLVRSGTIAFIRFTPGPPPGLQCADCFVDLKDFVSMASASVRTELTIYQ